MADIAGAGTERELRERVVAEVARWARPIIDERVYPPDEAAELIGLRGPRRGKTIREIDPTVLPRQPITPGGRLVGYLGRDLRRWNERMGEGRQGGHAA